MILRSQKALPQDDSDVEGADEMTVSRFLSF